MQVERRQLMEKESRQQDTTDSRRKGWPWQATEQGESGRKLRKPVQGYGQVTGAGPGEEILSPLKAG